MKRPQRTEARRCWSEVAAGRLDDPALREWLQRVAAEILRADAQKNDAGRRDAFVRALGLSGSSGEAADRYADIRAVVRLVEASPVAMFGPGADAMKASELRQRTRETVVAVCGLDEDLKDKFSRDRVDARIREALKDA